MLIIYNWYNLMLPMFSWYFGEQDPNEASNQKPIESISNITYYIIFKISSQIGFQD